MRLEAVNYNRIKLLNDGRFSRSNGHRRGAWDAEEGGKESGRRSDTDVTWDGSDRDACACLRVSSRCYGVGLSRTVRTACAHNCKVAYLCALGQEESSPSFATSDMVQRCSFYLTTRLVRNTDAGRLPGSEDS